MQEDVVTDMNRDGGFVGCVHGDTKHLQDFGKQENIRQRVWVEIDIEREQFQSPNVRVILRSPVGEDAHGVGTLTEIGEEVGVLN